MPTYTLVCAAAGGRSCCYLLACDIMHDSMSNLFPAGLHQCCSSPTQSIGLRHDTHCY